MNNFEKAATDSPFGKFANDGRNKIVNNFNRDALSSLIVIYATISAISLIVLFFDISITTVNACLVTGGIALLCTTISLVSSLNTKVRKYSGTILMILATISLTEFAHYSTPGLTSEIKYSVPNI